MGYRQHYRKLSGLGLLFTAALILSACGGGNAGSSSTATTKIPDVGRAPNGTLIPPPVVTGNIAPNVVPIVVDAGPVPGVSEINIAYVSVTVCPPGTPPSQLACQTIDHVQLDTGSFGLRLLSSTLYSNLNLPSATNVSGQVMGECAAFAIGTTWGSVHLADIYLGGEVARSVPIQEIGDEPGGAKGVPNDCQLTGTIQNTQAELGSNGILGVGLFLNDCPACLHQVVPAAYYACSTAGCTNSTVTAEQVVKNPVALFAQDNNGVVVELPAIADAGATGTVNGFLYFGIGTQLNNGLKTATVYPTDATGSIKTTYKNKTLPSYIDSGSNALFFDDTSIPNCKISTWVFCPTPSPMSLISTNASATGSPSALVHFNIVGADLLSGNVVAANIGGPSGNNNFVYGLPFFYGRTVYTAIAGARTPGGIGPYFAY